MKIGRGTKMCTPWHEKLDDWVSQDGDFDEELHYRPVCGAMLSHKG